MARPTQEAAVFRDYKFRFFDTVPESTTRCSLSFGSRNDAPRLIFFTGAATGPRSINVGMDVVTFSQFLTVLRDIADERTPRETKRVIENLGLAQGDAETPMPGGAKILRNTLVVGKDKEGVIWIGVKQADTACRVRILASEWHRFRDSQGQEPKADEASRCATLHLLDCLRAMRDACAAATTLYTPPQRNATGGVIPASDTTVSVDTASAFDSDFTI